MLISRFVSRFGVTHFERRFRRIIAEELSQEDVDADGGELVENAPAVREIEEDEFGSADDVSSTTHPNQTTSNDDNSRIRLKVPAAANQLLQVCFLSLRLLSARYVHDNNAAFELPEANSFKSVEDFVEAQRRAFVSGFRIST